MRATRAGGDDVTFPLAVGDKVTITVFGQQDLSGDYVVDGSGEVDMPLVGRIAVVDSRPREAEARIRSALANGYLRDASVNLRIAELKPVYVLGEVRSPGSYPFRFGLTVLGAVALAGGHRVLEQPLSLLKADFLVADERLRLLEITQQALDARRIRLEAQRDGKDRLVYPETWPTARDGLDPSGLITGEQDIFAFQMAAQAGELDILRKQRTRLEAEGRALAEQAELEKVQVDLTQSQVEDYLKLMDAGHARRPVLVERQRDDARARANLSRIRAEIARNDAAIGEIALRLRDVESNFQRRTVGELQDTRQRLLETARSLPTAREIRDGRLRQLASAGASQSGSPGWDLSIVRSRGRDTGTISANEGTALQPGDIVRVAPAPTARASEQGAALAPEPGRSESSQNFAATR